MNVCLILTCQFFWFVFFYKVVFFFMFFFFFFFQAEDGIRDVERSRGLGDVYKRQVSTQSTWDIQKMKAYFWDMMLFCRSWFNCPKQMGTIFPSSKSTGKAIANIIKCPDHVRVVEVGAGTGQITSEIVKLGIPNEQFVAIEYDSGLCEKLRKTQSQGLQVLNMDAADMVEKLPKEFIGHTDYLISTLPLIPMGEEKCRKVVDSIFTVLKPNGVYIQVTLSPAKPKYVDLLGLEATKICVSWLNIPPMHIWRIRRPSSSQQYLSLIHI
eukprot:TRINITY_DN4697_c0_g1_i4.p1 TRINITY_DN4697_c0_g1~~TRINITY_DN4697_c0_g1_i4.p1  ORF type:complete len:268 (+),score=51.00 TRINITY_DN4697_c0_g1_i4:36-839(+)